MASWGYCLEPLEKLESSIPLELKALREGTWKMGNFTVFYPHLVIHVTLELCALLKVVPKAHLEPQAILIDIYQCKPSWIVRGDLLHLRSWTV